MALKKYDRYNQYIEDFDDQLFASGESLYVACGPPRLSSIGGSIAAAAQLNQGAEQFARRLGFIQNFSLGQSTNLMRFFEVGSYRQYFIPGKTVGSISLSRIYYHGPSLLRAMYAYYQDLLPPTVIPSVFPNNAKLLNPHNVIIPPGYENIFMNLASDMFKQPIGLLIYMADSNDQTLGAMYVEQTYCPSHNTGWDSQGIVIQESVSLQYERILSIQTNSVALVTGLSNPLNS